MKTENSDSPSFRYVADRLGHTDFTLVLSTKGTSILLKGSEHAFGPYETLDDLVDQAPRAVVEDIDGQLTLIDPHATAMLRMMRDLACRGVAEQQADRVRHFAERVEARGLAPEDVVIVLIDVDDTSVTRALADALMPNHDWAVIRAQGEVPFARGLAGREGIQELLNSVQSLAAGELRAIGELAVVVFAHQTARAFPARMFEAP